MEWRRCMQIVVPLVMVVALPGAAAAKALVIPPRPGQVGLSIEGSYGMLTESGDIGSDFGTGPGLAVRLRYRTRYERAIGLSFESQKFDYRGKGPFHDPYSGVDVPADSSEAPASVTWITWGLDIYQMFGTRTNTTRMLSAGVGLVSGGHYNLNSGETEYLTSDGYYLSAGAGVEHFFWRSWAWDLNARYMAVFHESTVNNVIQATAGVVVYASY